MEETWQQLVTRLDFETSEFAEADFRRGARAGVRDFLLRPLLSSLRALREERRRPTAAIFAGYFELVRAAKLWEAEYSWRERLAVRMDQPRRSSLVHREWLEALAPVLDGTAAGIPLPGGRGGVVRHLLPAGPVIARRFRRGGGMRWLGEMHFGSRWRPFREFWVLATARRRGLPVPEPLAAVIEHRIPGVYSGLLVTAEIPGAVALPVFLAQHGPSDSARVLGARLREVHDAGLRHRDLNLGNVLVLPPGRALDVAFVDLDRASIRDRPLGAAARRRGLARLRRSARKIDPTGRLVSDEYLRQMEAAYAAEPGRAQTESTS